MLVRQWLGDLALSCRALPSRKLPSCLPDMEHAEYAAGCLMGHPLLQVLLKVSQGGDWGSAGVGRQMVGLVSGPDLRMGFGQGKAAAGRVLEGRERCRDPRRRTGCRGSGLVVQMWIGSM